MSRIALRDRREPTFDQGGIRNATTVVSSDPRVVELFGAPQTSAGVAVSEVSAMRVSAVYACVRIIGGAIASLPIDIFRRDPTGQARVVNIQNPLWWVLNEQPHPRWTAAAMWKWLAKSWLLRGDGFAWIQRDRAGTPIGLNPLHPASVQVENRAGRLVYFFADPDNGDKRGVDQDDMIHLPGFGFDGQRGLSAIQWGARSGIGIALATDDFAGRFFGAGAMSRHALKVPGKLTDPQIVQLRQAFEDRYAGLDNAYRPMVLTEGVDVKELSLSATDAQLLEARKFQVVDIARAFGVPPFMIGDVEKTTAWGSGVEHMSLGFVRYTLQERLTEIEQELTRKLFRTATTFSRFNVEGLLRGDTAARAAYLREMVGGSQGPGIITQDEARRAEGFAPLGGDADKLYDPRSASLTATTDTGAPANA